MLQSPEDDKRAVAAAAARGLTKTQATEIWLRRYEASSRLRTEFPTAAAYAAVMNLELVRKYQAAPTPPARDKNGLTAGEVQILNAARARGISFFETDALWREYYANTPALWGDFPTEQTYLRHMKQATRKWALA